MFCKHCGTFVPEENAFCTNCGTRRPTPVPQPENKKNLSTELLYQPLDSDLEEYSGRTALKKSYGSVVFLIATIMFTLSLSLEIASLFIPRLGNMFTFVWEVIELIEDYGPDMRWLRVLMGSRIALSLIPLIPSVVTTAALWIVWGSSRTKKKSCGFLILQIMVYLTYIPVILVMLLGIWICFELGERSQVFLILGAFMLTLIAFPVMYMVMLGNMYHGAHSVQKSGRGWHESSALVVFVNFLAVIFQILSIFAPGILKNFLGFGSMDTGGMIHTTLGALYLLFLTITYMMAQNAFDNEGSTENTEEIRSCVICTNCGKTIDADSRFCIYCGNPQTSSSVSQDETPLLDSQEKKKKKVPGWSLGVVFGVIGIGVAVLLGIGIAVQLFLHLNKPSINLNDYLYVEETGWEGYGKIELCIDTDKIAEDADKKYWDDETISYWMLYNAVEKLVSSGHWDKNGYLSNHQQVTYIFDFNKETLEETLDARIKYKNITYEISNLDPIEEFDPFESLEIQVDGYDGSGKLILKMGKTEIPGLLFSADKEKDLSTGDLITIKVSSLSNISLDKYTIENYGKKASRDTYTWTVPKLLPPTSSDQIENQEEKEETKEQESASMQGDSEQEMTTDDQELSGQESIDQILLTICQDDIDDDRGLGVLRVNKKIQYCKKVSEGFVVLYTYEAGPSNRTNTIPYYYENFYNDDAYYKNYDKSAAGLCMEIWRFTGGDAQIVSSMDCPFARTASDYITIPYVYFGTENGRDVIYLVYFTMNEGWSNMSISTFPLMQFSAYIKPDSGTYISYDSASEFCRIGYGHDSMKDGDDVPYRVTGSYWTEEKGTIISYSSQDGTEKEYSFSWEDHSNDSDYGMNPETLITMPYQTFSDELFLQFEKEMDKIQQKGTLLWHAGWPYRFDPFYLTDYQENGIEEAVIEEQTDEVLLSAEEARKCLQIINDRLQDSPDYDTYVSGIQTNKHITYLSFLDFDGDSNQEICFRYGYELVPADPNDITGMYQPRYIYYNFETHESSKDCGGYFEVWKYQGEQPEMIYSFEYSNTGYYSDGTGPIDNLLLDIKGGTVEIIDYRYMTSTFGYERFCEQFKYVDGQRQNLISAAIQFPLSGYYYDYVNGVEKQYPEGSFSYEKEEMHLPGYPPLKKDGNGEIIDYFADLEDKIINEEYVIINWNMGKIQTVNDWSVILEHIKKLGEEVE